MKQEEEPFELQKGIVLVHNKYTVQGKIGVGNGSTVHAITMTKGQSQIVRAIKQSSQVKEPQISTEVSILKQIKQCLPDEIGFPKLYEYGYENDFHYMVISLLGPNLDQLLKLCGGSFSLKTTMIISLQILDRLEIIHNLGYVYGDIKPDNFVVGLGPESIFIHMIDFGYCKRYKIKGTGQHIVYKQNMNYPFNQVFGSINSHNKIQASRRDDIQSLVYMLIFLKTGKLPWTRQIDPKRNKNDINAEQLKKRVTPEMLCYKMPLEIIDLIYYVKTIEYYQKPDYDFIRKMLYRCLQKEEVDFNIIYDWNKLQEVDFKVYSGQPRIVLKSHLMEETENNQNNEGTQKQAQPIVEAPEDEQKSNLLDG